jgi:hypothetical protein
MENKMRIVHSGKWKVCMGRCHVDHIENCNTCFGFGIRKSQRGRDGMIPVSAEESLKGEFPTPWEHCPECGSGPEGYKEGG